MSHSPGPWEAIDTDGEHHAIVAPDADQDHFTIVCIGPDDAGENANARLIAAAPDLLAALEGLVDIVEGIQTYGYAPNLDDGLRAAVEALTKANGK